MPILLAIIELLQSWAQRIRPWLVPLRARRGYKLPPSVGACHFHSPQKPEWLKSEIVRLKAVMPQAGCRTIADICNRRFAASRNVTVGKTFVHQTLQRHDYEIQVLRRSLKHAKPRNVPRNLIWGVDLTGKTDAQGRLHLLLGILDHGSRAVLRLQALRHKTSRSLLDSLRETIGTHGKPKLIRTDNEAVFTSHEFRRGLKRLGIRHQRTDPGCPWQNGRIERFFGTLKQKLDQWQVPDFVQLNRDLGVFRDWYNHVRSHQNLDGRTPAEVWRGADPYVKAPQREQWFEAWDGLLVGYCLR